jgi:hypothetical protein
MQRLRQSKPRFDPSGGLIPAQNQGDAQALAVPVLNSSMAMATGLVTR